MNRAENLTKYYLNELFEVDDEAKAFLISFENCIVRIKNNNSELKAASTIAQSNMFFDALHLCVGEAET